MAAKGDFLHGKLDETESLLRLENYYRDLAYGNSVTLQYYREQNADLFDAWEQTYHDKTYTLYTDSLSLDYALLSQLVSEYDTVAGYGDFLDSVQTKAGQLAGISIFQNDETGYDLKNIEVTAAVCAGLGETAIDYYPQKGLYTAISYAFTDLILLVSMLVQALLLVRQERDSGLLSLVRSLPGGRLQTALAKLGAFALSLLAVLALLYGVNLAYCAATFGLGPLTRTIQSVPALMRCTMQITVGQYLFRFLLAKWAGAFVMGLWVMLAALVARRAAAGWAAALAGPLVMFGIRAAIPATSRLNVIKYANLASLLQTNELLGNYRNLFWFGSPIGLPLVEWTAAVVYGGVLTFLILVHDLVKLLLEFVHHCNLAFLEFLFLTPGGAKPKQKNENNFPSLPIAVQKSFSLYTGQPPADKKCLRCTDQTVNGIAGTKYKNNNVCQCKLLCRTHTSLTPV